MFTPHQLEAIAAAALAKAARYAEPATPSWGKVHAEWRFLNRARLVVAYRAIASDALFLIDCPDCENTLASLDQSLTEYDDLAVALEMAA